MRSNKKGDILLDRFKCATEGRVDLTKSILTKEAGIKLLRESEKPSFGFEKLGLDLSSRKHRSIPASCAKPSILLQESAILDKSISYINLRTFDSFMDVVFDYIASWERIPGKFKSVCGRDWQIKAYEAIKEQHVKYMLYQMLVGGIEFEIKDEILAVHALVKYILSKPGASSLRTFLKEVGIDTADMLAVYQAWKDYEFSELFTFPYKKNPYFNATRMEVIEEYKRDLEGGTIKLEKYGVSSHIVGDSQEFSVFSSSEAVLRCMENFIEKKRNSKLTKAFKKSAGLDSPRKQERREIKVSGYSLNKGTRHRTAHTELTAGDLFREIERYSQFTGLGIGESIHRFCEAYTERYRENLIENTEAYRKRNLLQRVSCLQYLASTGRLRDGMRCMREMVASVCA